ncbi:UNVERIFIED_CONTAM: hypothetical protein O8I53_13565, partial [Campylobacter lari]
LDTAYNELKMIVNENISIDSYKLANETEINDFNQKLHNANVALTNKAVSETKEQINSLVNELLTAKNALEDSNKQNKI